MDVKSFFLHGNLVEEIYKEQLPHFMTNSTHACRLKNSLHGLKYNPLSWYEKIDQLFFNLSFKGYEYDHIIYALHANGNSLVFVVYVVDLVLARNTTNLLSRLKH